MLYNNEICSPKTRVDDLDSLRLYAFQDQLWTVHCGPHASTPGTYLAHIERVPDDVVRE